MKKYNVLILIAIIVSLSYLFIDLIYLALIPYALSSTIILYTLYDDEFRSISRFNKIIMTMLYSISLTFSLIYMIYSNMPYPKSFIVPILVSTIMGFNIWLLPKKNTNSK
ncbi:hypothetical protein KQ51_01172 [Candidatus Izimaplasma bacterium HR1]|jgi:hypothetical protein|uniref:hypothetical protein n=1 Tax=Candidatus Izimoplasma sp. HR1 TaxID=1541959 RepID=UPI0004F84C38|nr:hypothetical protein KQ51_01172 [Candidatus Izimaplasma bacterium HR1]